MLYQTIISIVVVLPSFLPHYVWMKIEMDERMNG
jgi:hypothetical protein